ncbi:MAG: hypothetical protein ACLFV8_11030 [Alphaproteobacteria bacterium]
MPYELTYRPKLSFTLIGITLMGVVSSAFGQEGSSLEAEKAKAIFSEAREISDREGGRLWGEKLYGPMFFVDPETRAVIANEADAEGNLQKQDDVYRGRLPKDVMVSNSPAEWAGKRWTMLIWPTLPEEPLPRRIMLAHEMFHRIQPKLGLDAPDLLNGHLDTLEGRLWLQLEWRALAAALVADGAAQSRAIRDALAFRSKRRSLFPGAAKSESGLEIAEGVPEYTGLTAAAPDTKAAYWHAVAQLTHPDASISFVRSFAYISGPPYGLLLDKRMPGWREKLSKQSDLGDLLQSSLAEATPVSAEERAGIYGVSAIRIAETDRAEKIAAQKARYRALLVEGPTLTLPKAGSFRYSFNPSTLISLGEAGTVYPTFHVTAAWGTLDVTDGVLVPPDSSSVTVAAPADTEGPEIQGPGWTLNLAPEWHLAPSSKPGSYVVKKRQ